VSIPSNQPAPELDARVDALISALTLEEKVDMLAGTSWMETLAKDRLGIPYIHMADGPNGVVARDYPFPKRGADGAPIPPAAPEPTTAFPTAVSRAATWDVDLVRRIGVAMGAESRAFGRDMLLGPTLNIQRVPHTGRNFESFSEDPYLAARMGVATIAGIQSQDVIACAKHFAANNQERWRHTVSAEVDERTLHEIYLPAFKAAVEEAGVWSVMSAYNRINGAWAAENPYLLRETLKERWGFRGFVVSDWVSTHSAIESANAGLDLEMPGAEGRAQLLSLGSGELREFATASGEPADPHGYFNRRHLVPAAESGAVKPEVIDDMARRLLRAMAANGLFERGRPAQHVAPDSVALNREAAAAGMVLLRNERDVLPLAAPASIAVIGPNADVARTGAGGSSGVVAGHRVSPLDGIRARAGAAARVTHAIGCYMENDRRAPEDAAAHAAAFDEAVRAARDADVAIVCVGFAPYLESEGFDRRSLSLPQGQDELIAAVAAANQNTVVVVFAGTPITMEWLPGVAGVLYAWYPGSEAGDAVADILFGDREPAGRLPITFPRRWEDSPVFAHYPGVEGSVEYAEGLAIGYRHFDAVEVEPLFPFGHGLGYTTFDYASLAVSVTGQSAEVTFSVRNSGARAGVAVPQVYVRDIESSLARPPKELKGFASVRLAPGESREVVVSLPASAFAFYDPAIHDWRAEPGDFEILVAASAADIRLRATVALAR
jgi:beta-glucosidase